uniref:5'-(N(7)-methylguanosine 5'-triphospho)-[mRNA] hydrolase n=1 Tax=Gallus gallus TaxID=9031 RepID=A0A8V0YGS6_CHICK
MDWSRLLGTVCCCRRQNGGGGGRGRPAGQGAGHQPGGAAAARPLHQQHRGRGQPGGALHLRAPRQREKTDVEGTLFVYTRSASPRHGFTIMNRLSMENRTEPITKDLDFQLQDPFLLYRNARFFAPVRKWK